MQRDDTRPRWPAWYGIAALGMALVITGMASGIVFSIVKLAGADVDSDTPSVNLVASIIQDAVLAVCAIWLAAQTARPTAAQFGLRTVSWKRGLKWGAIAFAIYFGFQIFYVAVFHPHQEQTTLNDLGAGTNQVMTLIIGLLVVGLAPLVEEFFFRGFFYGALRTSFPFLGAALIDAVVFGAIHAPTGIQAVPPLIVLGFAFCVAYEMTGSIVPGIILHALNNMIAFGADKDGSWAVAAIAASAVLIVCVTLPGRPRTL